ncbi:NADH-quinone oxidoreductase subunit J [Enterobacteriaceae endosymbiont of Plateumaris sericea]|uniref:NADH-quinone oxidoreductase subunit J family protein n=1 Tax=Enterobacteriaceae endosymbiont of Plateumaris sericea TaxID=2675797 RepID=UPI001449B4D7|nr:NADH-quinone oxidoreductase subunit J [Enterobacteriaceae endosymbiont of Plateumaris sericea]QJC30098.1 NADH-quinone oxidoreductase subunit J [Enterobacteriaceae endosymbiont of Plateumaris sericea]
MEIIFYILGLLSIISTLCVVISINPMYTLVYFLVSLISISGIFFTLGDYFAGALEIIIYAGAIVVLFVFVLMLLNHKQIALEEKKILIKKPIVLISSILLTIVLLFFLIFMIKASCNNKYIFNNIIDINSIGINMFKQYKIIVELISILLLAGLIIVFHIGNKKN